jgi:hypothetical protein
MEAILWSRTITAIPSSSAPTTSEYAYDVEVGPTFFKDEIYYTIENGKLKISKNLGRSFITYNNAVKLTNRPGPSEGTITDIIDFYPAHSSSPDPTNNGLYDPAPTAIISTINGGLYRIQNYKDNNQDQLVLYDYYSVPVSLRSNINKTNPYVVQINNSVFALLGYDKLSVIPSSLARNSNIFTNNWDTLSLTESGENNENVNSIYVEPITKKIYVATNDGLYVSNNTITDLSISFTKIYIGIVRDVFVVDSKIYIATANNAFMSEDGATWTNINAPLNDLYRICVMYDTVFVLGINTINQIILVILNNSIWSSKIIENINQITASTNIAIISIKPFIKYSE